MHRQGYSFISSFIHPYIFTNSSLWLADIQYTCVFSVSHLLIQPSFQNFLYFFYFVIRSFSSCHEFFCVAFEASREYQNLNNYKYFTPLLCIKLLSNYIKQIFHEIYIFQLLTALFKFLSPFLRNAELAKPVQKLYRGNSSNVRYFPRRELPLGVFPSGNFQLCDFSQPVGSCRLGICTFRKFFGKLSFEKISNII